MRIYSFSDVKLNQINENFLLDFASALGQLKHLTQLINYFKIWQKTKWFFILGHQSAGKTELIRASEDKIFYEWHDPKKQFSFYFCEKKVFVEISEKYLLGTQADLLLKRVIKIIKPYRAELSGVLICLNLYQLLTFSKTQRQGILNDIKRMIIAIQKIKKTSFWLIFTYLDIVNGFKEFFDDLLDIERQHSFGLEIKSVENASELIELFNHEFRLLLDHINQRLIRCLHHIRDQDLRMLANDFPSQFEQMAGLIRNILRHLFKQDDCIKLIKGIYFVSSKQITTSIDRIVRPISKQVVLSTPFISNKKRFSRSYFSHEIFQERIMQQSPVRLFSASEFWKMLQLTIGSATLIITLWLAYSFKIQVNQLSQIESLIQSYKHQMKKINAQNNYDLVALLSVIENMSAIKNSIQNFDSVWMLLPFMENLNQLKIRTSQAYQKILVQQFIPRIALEFENILNNPKAYTDEVLYSALKGYMMLIHEKRFDPVYISLWFRMHWEKDKQNHFTKTQIKHYSDQLYDLLKQNVVPIQLNYQLVFKVRQHLKNLTLAKLIFLKIKNLSDYSGYHLTKFNDHHVPAVFTKKGYEAIYLPQVQRVLRSFDRGDWVLGHLPDVQPGQLSIIHEQIDQLYFTEYKKWWQRTIQKLDVLHTKNLKDSENTAFKYAKIDNTLFNAINTLIVNTKPFNETNHSIYKKFNANLSESFKPFHQIKTDLLMKVVKNFYDLGHDLHSINTAVLSDQQAFLITKAHFLEKTPVDPLSNLFKLTEQFPKPIADLLEHYFEKIWQQLIQKTEAHIYSKWQSKVMPFYEKNIYKKYPVDIQAEQDITLDNFNRFFAYQGILNKFFETNIAPFIETNSTRWQRIVKNNHTVSLTDSMIEQFERAYIIRKMFFNQKGPDFSFSLQPVKFSADLSSIVIDISGQQIYDYQGSHKQTNFKWPASNQNDYVTMLLENYKGHVDTVKFMGPWALLKLSQAYHLKPVKSTNQYHLHLDTQHGKGDYLLVANSKINPFIDGIIGKFLLKDHLFLIQEK